MGFGKMISGLFKKDDEAFEKTQKAERAVRDKSGTENESVARSQDGSQTESVPSNNERVNNASTAESSTGDKPAASGESSGVGQVTEQKVLEVLSQVYDPEIPIDIVNLGLIYGVEIEGGRVLIRMTMTAPGCPASTQIAGESRILVEELPGVESCDIDLVWDPPWDPSKMSEEAQESLGIF